jgi:DnaD/phage-associated family protein
MARARLLKPSFFTNEELVELPPVARLLFAGLWTIADREGRLEDRPKRIKMQLLPADPDDVNTLLDLLHDRGFVLRYEVDGQRYLWIPTFLRHQNPHHREPSSEIPGPDRCEPAASLGPALGQTGADLGPDYGEPEASRAVAVTGDPVTGDPVAVAVMDPEVTTTTAEAELVAVIRHWEHATGTTIRPLVADDIADQLTEKVPIALITDAIDEAVRSSQGAPSWKYTKAILDRWKREGRNSNGRNGYGRSHPRGVAVGSDPDDPYERIIARARAAAE